MIALTDSQWIDFAPFVLAFVIAVVVINVTLIVASVWCTYRPPRSRRVRRWEIERQCGSLVDRQDA